MRIFTLLVTVLAACGGSAGGEELVSGGVSGAYKGSAFTPMFGYATTYKQSSDTEAVSLIGLGTDGIHCGSEKSSSPPGGSGIIISNFNYVTGDSTPFVQIFRNSGGYNSYGSTGMLKLTDVNDDTVSGTVDFDDTDAMNDTYAAHGDFVVTRCPQ
ncbi:MAG TPA: hypothetical protein VGM39_00430 [Kofleriaceae bacterium]|jgi:hypothetical protein